jgi:hypothetical protein
VAKVYIVSFRTHDDRRPSKFIVLADNMRAAINKAWEHGGADFQSRYDNSTETHDISVNEEIDRLAREYGKLKER